MSELDNLNGPVTDPLQARFGVPVGTLTAEDERHRWEQLCRELHQERDHLCSELARAKHERAEFLRMYSELVAEGFTLTKEEVLARLDQEPILFQVIDELGP